MHPRASVSKCDRFARNSKKENRLEVEFTESTLPELTTTASAEGYENSIDKSEISQSNEPFYENISWKFLQNANKISKCSSKKYSEVSSTAVSETATEALTSTKLPVLNNAVNKKKVDGERDKCTSSPAQKYQHRLPRRSTIIIREQSPAYQANNQLIAEKEFGTNTFSHQKLLQPAPKQYVSQQINRVCGSTSQHKTNETPSRYSVSSSFPLSSMTTKQPPAEMPESHKEDQNSISNNKKREAFPFSNRVQKSGFGVESGTPYQYFKKSENSNVLAPGEVSLNEIQSFPFYQSKNTHSPSPHMLFQPSRQLASTSFSFQNDQLDEKNDFTKKPLADDEASNYNNSEKLSHHNDRTTFDKEPKLNSFSEDRKAAHLARFKENDEEFQTLLQYEKSSENSPIETNQHEKKVEIIQQELRQKYKTAAAAAAVSESDNYSGQYFVPDRNPSCLNTLNFNILQKEESRSSSNHRVQIKPCLKNDSWETTPKQEQNTRSKLMDLQAKIVSFETQLQTESKQKKAVEEHRLHILGENLCTLEKTLHAEMRRRAEANQTIQHNFETQLINFEQQLQTSLQDKEKHIVSAVEAMQNRLIEAKSEVEIIKKAYDDLLEKIHLEVDKTKSALSSTKDLFEQELKLRKQREAAIFDKVSNIEKQVEARLSLEKGIRQKDLDQLEASISAINHNHIAWDEEFQKKLAGGFHELKTALETEKMARERADDDIVQALNHYTIALQAALKVANSS